MARLKKGSGLTHAVPNSATVNPAAWFEMNAASMGEAWLVIAAQ